ncbi:MAG: hypothetical protein ACI81I_000709 [Arcobacteraceae bacterium]
MPTLTAARLSTERDKRSNMKNPNRDTVSKLEALPNIGKAIASDLRLIGIQKPKDLIGQNPFDLHNKLCIKKEKEIDPCVIDTFMAVISFMEGGESLPWWAFTQKRKLILK